VLTDIRMGGMSGLELFDQLKARGSLLPVIVLTGHGDVPMAVGALQRGVFDFVEKPFNDNSLIDKLFIAMARNADKAAAQAERQSVLQRLARLSEREREVMALLLEGLMNKVIAGKLDVAMRTVEVHRASVFEKMQVRSAVSLANLLARHDLPDDVKSAREGLTGQ
jgi:two-component system, LuxR family, response regulator DctR